MYSSFLALKSNGEIWAHGWSPSPPSLYLVLPADREWCGFLPGPVLACEGSDAFDALGRTFTSTRAELPRLLFLRIWFILGVER